MTNRFGKSLFESYIFKWSSDILNAKCFRSILAKDNLEYISEKRARFRS
ncbi:hypothetical protein HanIR_Chr07g0313111 [Helianthus annuus]|nr:hypothetical protein HanIR_Chr07g0313111 [Helianthus annuus]